MRKILLNIVIDTFSLIIFTSMISTGLLLKFILPPGSGRAVMLFQGGRQGEKTIDLFMGLTRHEWGQIHLYIALIFLALLILHLFLHWSWIKGVVFGSKNNPQPLKRKIIAIGIIFFIVLTVFFPWIGSKKTYTRSEFLESRKGYTPQ